LEINTLSHSLSTSYLIYNKHRMSDKRSHDEEDEWVGPKQSEHQEEEIVVKKRKSNSRGLI
jgi:hypothetical protein